MQETVLLYNIDKTDAGKAIISILEKLNVEVIIVKSSDLMSPIGYILGADNFERGTEALTEIPQDDMMVMAFHSVKGNCNSNKCKLDIYAIVEKC